MFKFLDKDLKFLVDTHYGWQSKKKMDIRPFFSLLVRYQMVNFVQVPDLLGFSIYVLSLNIQYHASSLNYMNFLLNVYVYCPENV